MLDRIRVREASAADRNGLLACMAEVLDESSRGLKPREFATSLWEWQYERNERGSVIVVAEDEDLICGYYHIPLYNMRVADRHALGAVVQDVATRKAYRGLGVFRAMGAFALERMRARGAEMVYTFPNHRSRPSFLRNHDYTEVTQVPVYVAVLNAGPLLAGRLGWAAGERVLGQLATPLVGAWHARGRFRASLAMPLAGFSSDLDVLAREFAAPMPVGLERTARYLNWRFTEKPTGEYSAWGLCHDGSLVAYLVTRHAEMFGTRCVVLMDFGCRGGEEFALLHLIANRLASERAEGVALGITMGLHPFFRRLRTVGFLRVPERFNPRPFHLLTNQIAPDLGSKLDDPTSWHITLADYDVL